VYDKSKGNNLLLYSELGGNFLGQLVVPRCIHRDNVFGVLQDLQLQAYDFMKHEWRPPSEVLLKVDNKMLLPCGFGYKNDLDLDEQQEALSNLQDALASKKRVLMTYDDTDEYVTSVFTQAGLHVARNMENNKTVHITITSKAPSFSSCLTRFCSNCDASTIKIMGMYSGDMSWFEGIKAPTLRLYGVAPSSWAPLSNLVDLFLDGMCVPSGISKLVLLKHLTLAYVRGIPDDLALLDLHTLCVKFSSPIIDRLLSLLVMPHLAKLSLSDMFARTFPLVLGNLTSLKHLKLNRIKLWRKHPKRAGSAHKLVGAVHPRLVWSQFCATKRGLGLAAHGHQNRRRACLSCMPTKQHCL
jgi:hypothetical protein